MHLLAAHYGPHGINWEWIGTVISEQVWPLMEPSEAGKGANGIGGPAYGVPLVRQPSAAATVAAPGPARERTATASAPGPGSGPAAEGGPCDEVAYRWENESGE